MDEQEREVHRLFERANKIAGREVEVQQLPSGQYIVEFFSFSKKPPPRGNSAKEALEKFIDYMVESTDNLGGISGTTNDNNNN